jgi:predicted dehydrogenase
LAFLMADLSFGIIGLSPGNGHPYSWSAIFNGYDREAMADCPFPAIPQYLAERSFPRDAIEAASVTHIWTEDAAVSRHVAAAARIPDVVDRPEDMIGRVDAVLLARDDAERHLDMAGPFLDAGLAVYIDKPLALSIAEAGRIYARQRRPGQVFTCSALAYADEFRLDDARRTRLGRLLRARATTPKDWDRYAIHVIEPLSAIADKEGPVERTSVMSDADGRHLTVEWQSGFTATITALGSEDGEIAIDLRGTGGRLTMNFADTFAAFRAALADFTDQVLGKRAPQRPEDVLPLIALVEAGRAQ